MGIVSAVTLLIGADAREFSGIVRYWPESRAMQADVHWARMGRWKNRNFLAIANGVGRYRAAQVVEIAMRQSTVESIYNVGFCGALDSNLSIGDIFVGTEVLDAGERHPTRLPRTAQRYGSGVVASIDYVAQTAGQKSALRSQGASVVEMEAAGVAAKAREHGIPFYCVRSVSDLANETFACDLNAALRSDGRFDTFKLLRSALGRPTARIPELFKLQQRCRIASNTLGDFLANCDF